MTGLRNFSLPTPSRTASISGGRKRSSAGSANEPYIVLSEGIREDEVIRGLTTAVAGVVDESEKAGVVEKEIERLWNKESRRIRKDLEKIERRRVEEEEKKRMDELAFKD